MARVLLINPPDAQCGVHQYFVSVQSILRSSQKHQYVLANMDGDIMPVKHGYDVLVYNYHEKLCPWLCNEWIRAREVPCLAIGGHDCYPDFSELKLILNCDSASEPTKRNIPLPRPVRNFAPLPNPERITIGSCGFAFGSKNFQHVATVVAQSYDDALIRLHMPQHPHGEPVDAIVGSIRQQLWNLNKPNIDVEISTDFLSDEELISFLSSNTANVFLYPPFTNEKRGLSSAIDKALSARKPIAISDSTMYRHINTEDKFLLSKFSLAEIISFGVEHIKPFWATHSEEKLIKVFDSAVDKALCS